ncbi:LysR family transcriptional regulator [Lysinibacillus sp. BF-4]|uniref:RidA family protein n=1 Tax=Lysinibacillus sp. BF-4 TaxID=1473546 RepID=UPI000505097A|nr:RidA family protein [Lysinibacillus sp. BF-4]KFL42340.1 LysR family transcriptional regulator [Lysinibacillus sp. BF-4]
MIEQRLQQLGITLPAPAKPLFHYVPVTVHNGVAYISGQVPRVDGEVPYTGQVGGAVSVEQAQELAEVCVLKALSALKAEIGSLDKVVKVLKVTGYVQTSPTFSAPSIVLDSASELLTRIFGEAGRHARTAVGVAQLPSDTPVEIDFIFAVEG